MDLHSVNDIGGAECLMKYFVAFYLIKLFHLLPIMAMQATAIEQCNFPIPTNLTSSIHYFIITR